MKNRFILFQRSGVFYCEDTSNGRQTSLRTKDKADALRLLHVKNEAAHQPAINLQIAQNYPNQICRGFGYGPTEKREFSKKRDRPSTRPIGRGLRFSSYAAATPVTQSFFVAPPDNTLVGIGFQNRNFQMAYYGIVGSNYAVQASSNLLNWQPFTNFILTVSPYNFADPAATNFNRRFYRAGPP